MADSAGLWSSIKRFVSRMQDGPSDFRIRRGLSNTHSNMLRKEDISRPMQGDHDRIRDDFTVKYSQVSPPDVMRIPNSSGASRSENLDPADESVTAEILEYYLSSSNTSSQRSDPSQSAYTQKTGVLERQEISQVSGMVNANTHQPDPRSSNRHGVSLKQANGPRMTIIPEVSEEQLMEYAAAHISSEAGARRDSISLQHSLPPQEITNYGGSPNQYDGTSRRNIPQEILDRAVRRKGFDPSNPAGAKALERKHSEERASFTSGERQARNSEEQAVRNGHEQLEEYKAVHASSEVAALRDGTRLQRSHRPLEIANSDGSRNQYDGTTKGEVPWKVLYGAVRRRGFDPSNPDGVNAQEGKRSEERASFTRAETQASKPAAERNGYDDRKRGRGSGLGLS